MREGNNEFSKAVHSRGWTVWAACEYWGIRYQTFYDRVNNPKMAVQLMSMCLGLEDKVVTE